MKDYSSMLPPNRCSFDSIAEVFGWPACFAGLQRHHVLSRSKLKGNNKAIALVEKKYRKIFIRWVCAGHNCSKYADTQKGRAWLLAAFPTPIVRQALEEIQKCYKGGYPDISYDALMEVLR